MAKHSKAKTTYFVEGMIEALAEAAENSRPVWDTVLIRPGLSKNMTYYPEAVLTKAAKLFEGAPAFARSDEEHSGDANKSVKNIIGVFKEVVYREGALRGKLHILTEGQWLHDKMLEARSLGKHDLFGLSIVAGGTASLRKRNGQVMRMVESIDKVVSVDPVVNPAAGGRLVKLAAAEDDRLQGEIEMLQALIKMIEAKRPDLLKDKDLENITEAEIMELAETAMLTEADILAAKTEKPAATAETEDPTKIINEKFSEAEKRWHCRMLMAEKLHESGLPDEAKALIRRLMPAVFTEAELDKAIKSAKDFIAKFSESGKVKGAGVSGTEITLDERDRKLAALDGFFFNEARKVGDQLVPPYRSFKKAYRDITGDNDLTGLLREATRLSAFVEATGLDSSSFAQVLGDSITRRMIAEYQNPEYTEWRQVASDIGTINDFRTNRRMRFGGYDVLPAVAEAGAYTGLTSPTDEEATYAIGKKGGTENITMEMIANDDVGAIRRIPLKLALAAKITLYRDIFDIFTANAATTYDSVALFELANHKNIGSSALAQASLTATRQLMRDQAGYNDAKNILGIVPKTLLVPNELEEMAMLLTRAGKMIPASGETTDLPTLHTGMGYVVVDYWTNAKDWFAICDPRRCPTIEVGFFQGREEPELFLQSMPNVGSMFDNDKLTYKIRFIYGTCVLEHRGMYYHDVA